MNTTPRLHIENLSFSYSEKELFSGVNMTIEPGSIVSLQGRNGTGKSTLLKCIAGLIQPTTGTITVNAKELATCSPLERSMHIGVLWTERFRLPGFTLRDLVMMGTYNAHKSSSRHQLEKVIEGCLSMLQLQALADRSLSKLSDGELQKGMIARALAQQPSFLLLDEPTTYLDYVAKEELMQTLQIVCKTNSVGILFTSHDLEIIRSYAHRRFELADRKVTTIP